MARQSIYPAFAKWGAAATQFKVNNILGGGTPPTSTYGFDWKFDVSTDRPIATGLISPSRVIVPSKEPVNMKLYVIWMPGGALTTDKIGFLAAIAMGPEDGSPFFAVPGYNLPSTATVNADGESVDWTDATLAVKAPHELMQWGIAYDSNCNSLSIRKTQIYQIKYNSSGALVADPTWSFTDFYERFTGTDGVLTYDSAYLFGGLYLFRMAGLTASVMTTSVIADGMYDGDGDGALDTDNSLQDAFVFGVMAEFY